MFTDYRFYTEKEFIAKYGEAWRSIVMGGWAKKMDILIGKPIDPNFYEACQAGNMFRLKTHEGQCEWNIFPTMYREYSKYKEPIEQVIL